MSTITGYHAHVYFDAAERERAQHLCESARAALGVIVGRMHDGPVGPHPRGSCQLTVVPGPTSWSRSAAATHPARWASSAKVSVRPRSSRSITASGLAAARLSTSCHHVVTWSSTSASRAL